jgi:hypothetical protein
MVVLCYVLAYIIIGLWFWQRFGELLLTQAPMPAPSVRRKSTSEAMGPTRKVDKHVRRLSYPEESHSHSFSSDSHTKIEDSNVSRILFPSFPSFLSMTDSIVILHGGSNFQEHPVPMKAFFYLQITEQFVSPCSAKVRKVVTRMFNGWHWLSHSGKFTRMMMMFCLYSAVFPCYSSMLAALKEKIKTAKKKKKKIRVTVCKGRSSGGAWMSLGLDGENSAQLAHAFVPTHKPTQFNSSRGQGGYTYNA